jgi:branched-chain amino acid transport system substrate-binding protein
VKLAPTPTRSAPQPIVLGVSLGLSGGGFPDLNIPLRNATKVAELQVNAAGGLFGRPVEFRVVDDLGDSAQHLHDLVGGLLDGGVVALIGPTESGQVLATQSQTFMKQVIQIASAATSTELTTAQPKTNRFLFRTTPADDLQAQAIVQIATSAPSLGLSIPVCHKMAILQLDNPYGNALAAGVTSTFQTHGSVAPTLRVGEALKDNYRTEVAAMMGQSAECVVVISSPQIAAQFMIDVNAAKIAGTVPSTFYAIGSDGVYDPAFIRNARVNPAQTDQATAVEGVIGTHPDSNPQTLENREFRDLYLSQFSLEPGETELPAYVSNQYDACILAVLALEEAGTTTDPLRIKQALFDVSRVGTAYGPAHLVDAFRAIQRRDDIDYKGASGDVDFNEYGNVVGGYIVWQVEGGKYVTKSRVTPTTMM